MPRSALGRFIYSPVLKVTYKVPEATRVEQRTDFDRAILDVGDQELDQPARRLASASKTWSSVRSGTRLNVEAEGIEDRPVAGRGRPHRGIRAADPDDLEP